MTKYRILEKNGKYKIQYKLTIWSMWRNITQRVAATDEDGIHVLDQIVVYDNLGLAKKFIADHNYVCELARIPWKVVKNI